MLADTKAKTVTNKLPQLTVLVAFTRLPPCHGMKEVSPESSSANGLVMFYNAYKFSPFAAQMQVGRKKYQLLQCLIQFAFDHS